LILLAHSAELAEYFRDISGISRVYPGDVSDQLSFSIMCRLKFRGRTDKTTRGKLRGILQEK
jgi:hypothetical protein